MNQHLTKLFSLEGQTAIVTGGTRGIGQAMAIGLAEAGADIILAQVTLSNLRLARMIMVIWPFCVTLAFLFEHVNRLTT
jgi:short-subunit dehydrogenase involved in D-alanine esterification of teichoic acids